MQIFEVILFFKLRTTIQQKTVIPTYLLSVRCQEAGGRKRLAGGKRKGINDFNSLVLIRSVYMTVGLALKGRGIE